MSVVLSALFVLLAAAVLALPSILRFGGEKWLRDQGLEAGIEAVELDLSEGWLVIRGARGKAPDGGGFDLRQLRVTWRWSPLWDRQVQIAGLEVDGLRVDAGRDGEGAWRVAGLALPGPGVQQAVPEAEPSLWRYRIGDINLTDLQACYRDVRMAQQPDPLQSGFAAVCARWDDLDWRGEMGAGPIPVDGTRALPWEATGSLGWRGFSVATPDGVQTRAAFRELAIDGLRVQGGGIASAKRITLAALRLADPLHAAHQADWLTLDGLEFEGAALTQGESLQLDAAKLRHATLLQSAGPRSGQTLAGCDDLALAGLHIGALGGLHDLTLERATARGVAALERSAPQKDTPPYIAALKRIDIEGLAMPEPSVLRIRRLQLETPELWLMRGAAGRWELVDWLSAPESREAPADAASRRALQLRIGELQIGGDGAVTLYDGKVSPPYRETLGGLALTLGDIDNAVPAQASPLKIEARIGEYGKLALTGEIRPFAARPDLKLSGTISGVDLAPLTAYARDALQQNIRQGSLDAELKIAIDNGRLDSAVDLELHKLELSPLSEQELAGSAEQELGIPLNAALSLLRDSDDAIRLNLPVEGAMDSPDVSVRNVLGKVMGKAIRSAIVAYYSPFGLLKLAGAVLDLATGLSFEPIPFAVGDARLPTTARRPLGELAKLLNERPQVRLALCGEATRADFDRLFPPPPAAAPPAEDRPATNERPAPEPGAAAPGVPPGRRVPTAVQSRALRELAAQRGRAVKEFLVRKGGIEPKRLVVCNPDPALGEETPAVVRISI